MVFRREHDPISLLGDRNIEIRGKDSPFCRNIPMIGLWPVRRIGGKVQCTKTYINKVVKTKKRWGERMSIRAPFALTMSKWTYLVGLNFYKKHCGSPHTKSQIDTLITY